MTSIVGAGRAGRKLKSDMVDSEAGSAPTNCVCITKGSTVGTVCGVLSES